MGGRVGLLDGQRNPQMTSSGEYVSEIMHSCLMGSLTLGSKRLYYMHPQQLDNQESPG